MDTVKLNVVLQLKSLGLEHIKVDIKDSTVVLDEKNLMTLENIPLIFNNKNLAILKNEHAAIEKEFWELSAKVHNNPEDKDARARFLHLSGEMNRLNEAMHSLQKDILAMETSFLEKSGSGYISPRQKQARLCLEDGDIEGAKKILAEDELEKEEVQALELMDEMKKKLQALVGDWLQRIDVLKLDIQNSNRFTEIDHCFEKAIKLEKDGGLLERKSLRLYADYQFNQNNFEKAIKYAQLYLHWLVNSTEPRSCEGSPLESEGKEGMEIASIYNFIARCLSGLNRYSEANELYRKALVIHEYHAKENPAAVEPYLAIIYNNMAFSYDKIENFTEAEELYKKALIIYESLIKNNPFEQDLAAAYNNLACLYKKNRRYSEAEELFRKTLAIRERLAKESPAAFEPDLALTYNNLARLYDTTERYAQAEELYKKILVIYERLTKGTSAAFMPFLAGTYSNMAHMYGTTERYTEAEELFRKALAVHKRLAKENPEVFEPDLAANYNNLANLYDITERYTDAEEQYRNALVIYEQMAKENPDVFEPDLAANFTNLADLYAKTERYTETEELYRKALVIYERLMINTPEEYADSYDSSLFYLVDLLHDMGKYEEAEPLYHKLIGLREKLASENPEEYEALLATALNNLGSMFRTIQRNTEAEQLYNRALVLQKNIFEKNQEDDYSKNELAAQLYRFGLLYEQTDRLAEAQASWRQALDIWETMNEDEIGDYTESFENTRNKLAQGAL
jgi:tetratricopeptide (TPR) repeat protein